MFIRPFGAICGNHWLAIRHFSKVASPTIHSNTKIKKQNIRAEKNWENKALDLIFGRRDYDQFTDAEKALVNRYQDQILLEGPMVMRNTELFKSLEAVKKKGLERSHEK